jgi:hypothetical protein
MPDFIIDVGRGSNRISLFVQKLAIPFTQPPHGCLTAPVLKQLCANLGLHCSAGSSKNHLKVSKGAACRSLHAPGGDVPRPYPVARAQRRSNLSGVDLSTVPGQFLLRLELVREMSDCPPHVFGARVGCSLIRKCFKETSK